MSSRRTAAIAIGGAAAAGIFLLNSSIGSKIVPNDMNSLPGVKNIGDRYSAGGGSTTHLPGAATPRGNAENVISNQEKPTGIDTQAFKDRHADQKLSEPNALGKAWHQTHYGNDKGK